MEKVMKEWMVILIYWLLIGVPILFFIPPLVMVMWRESVRFWGLQ